MTEQTVPAEQTQPAPAAPQAEPAEEAFDAERAMRTIRALRDEVKQFKGAAKELDVLRAEAKRVEDAKLSESEKAAKRLAELEQELNTTRNALVSTRRTSLVTTIASQMQANDPNDANIVQATAHIDPDAEGADKLVRAAIVDLQKTKAYLFRNAAGSASFNSADGTTHAETDAQRRARIYGGGGSIFDPQSARALGGGVVISSKNLGG